MTSYNMLNTTKDFQETLHEVLNTRLNTKSKQEIVMQEILRKSIKHVTSDFQESLKKSVKELSLDKVSDELKDKNKKAQKEKNQDSLKINNQIKSDITETGIEKELEKDENEEKSQYSTVNNDESLTRREALLKHMYSVALDEYYTLRNNLYKGQLKDNNIALDDKNYLKLLQYENYLRKCDTLFKSSYGSYIASQDDTISKRENKYAYDAAKSGKAVINEHADRVNEIDNLNFEIESKANQIIELNESAKNGNVQDYEKKLDMLEKEYVALNVKISMLRPNILELHRQEEQKQEQDNVTTRVVGTKYQHRKAKTVMDAQVVRLDKKLSHKEEKHDTSAGKEKEQLENTNITLANSYIDAAEKALKKENVTEAKVMVGRAKKLVGEDQIENITHDKKSDFTEILRGNVSSGNEKVQTKKINTTESIDKHLDKVNNSKIPLSPVQKECAKSVHTPEERSKNILAREIKEENVKVVVREKDDTFER